MYNALKLLPHAIRIGPFDFRLMHGPAEDNGTGQIADMASVPFTR